jgi:hypothetical protein
MIAPTGPEVGLTLSLPREAAEPLECLARRRIEVAERVIEQEAHQLPEFSALAKAHQRVKDSIARLRQQEAAVEAAKQLERSFLDGESDATPATLAGQQAAAEQGLAAERRLTGPLQATLDRRRVEFLQAAQAGATRQQLCIWAERDRARVEFAADPSRANLDALLTAELAAGMAGSLLLLPERLAALAAPPLPASPANLIDPPTFADGKAMDEYGAVVPIKPFVVPVPTATVAAPAGPPAELEDPANAPSVEVIDPEVIDVEVIDPEVIDLEPDPMVS